MHELSLAQGILRLVGDHVPPDRLADVRSVRVDIGRLSGVVADSLEFCFSALVAGTTLRRARLCLNTIPLQLDCADCQQTIVSERDIFECPVCHGKRTTVVSGMDLRVAEIELEDVKSPAQTEPAA
jgi:hydrogenase nickel incorporation protein HypA/HybF